MSDENGQAEKTPEEKSAKSGGLDFGAVIAKLRDLGSFLSLDGKASRGEFWTTVLLVSLPLAILSGVFTTIALLLEPSDFLHLFSFPVALFTALASISLVVASLAMFPVMVRRLRDAKLSPWLAVVCFAVSAIPCPYIAPAGWLLILAAGVLPPKDDADGASAMAIAVKAKMWVLVTLLSVLAAAMMVGMTALLIVNCEKRLEKTFTRGLEKAKKEFEKEGDKQSEKMKKGLGSQWDCGGGDAGLSGTTSARSFSRAAGDVTSGKVEKFERLCREMAKLAKQAGKKVRESEIQEQIDNFKRASGKEQDEMIRMFEENIEIGRKMINEGAKAAEAMTPMR